MAEQVDDSSHDLDGVALRYMYMHLFLFNIIKRFIHVYYTEKILLCLCYVCFHTCLFTENTQRCGLEKLVWRIHGKMIRLS